MAIDWEMEEGCHEYNRDGDSSSISILGPNEVAMYGHFNFEEIEATYQKMKELQEKRK